MPARAPPSMDMLQIVMRCFHGQRANGGAGVFKDVPVPPPMPILAIRARMMSLAETPGQSCPSTRTSQVLGLRCKQALRGQDVLDFAGADAKGQRAKRAVRGGVAVAADDGHARAGSGPSSGPITWTMP